MKKIILGFFVILGLGKIFPKLALVSYASAHPGGDTSSGNGRG